MDTSWTKLQKAKSRFVPQKNPWKRRGKQRQTTGGLGERSRFHQGNKRKKSRRRKEERRATRMRENTERRESKSPGRALWGWINTTPPRIREGATIHQPPLSCVSFSQLHFDNDIYLKPNPPTLFLPSSFLATASVVPRGWCTHQPPFSRGRSTRRIKLHAIQIQYPFLFSSSSVEPLLGYTSIRSLFLPANFGCRLDVCEFVRFLGSFCGLAFDPFAFWEGFFLSSLGRVKRKRFEREKRL